NAVISWLDRVVWCTARSDALTITQQTGIQHGLSRPVRLAIGTVMRSFVDLDAGAVLTGASGLTIVVRCLNMDQADVPGAFDLAEELSASWEGAGSEMLVQIDYNEPRDAAEAHLDIPVARDLLDLMTVQLAAGVAALDAFCTAQALWRDAGAFAARWTAAKAALYDQAFLRPYEFAATPDMRNALDASWALLRAVLAREERFLEIAGAYYLLRDAGWAELDDEDGFEGSNADHPPSENIASNPPPSVDHGYHPH
ncbi:MAG: hypothetical protein AAGD12_08600, partial [Pseudomonadota bacterium]